MTEFYHAKEVALLREQELMISRVKEALRREYGDYGKSYGRPSQR